MVVGLFVLVYEWLTGLVLASLSLLALPNVQKLADELLLLVLAEEGEQQIDLEEVSALVLRCRGITYWRTAL